MNEPLHTPAFGEIGEDFNQEVAKGAGAGFAEIEDPPSPFPVILAQLGGFSPTFGRLAGAMAAAQAIMTQPLKTKIARITFKSKDNGQGQGREKVYKYCDIADILTAVLKPLGTNGLALFQFPIPAHAESFTVYGQDGSPQQSIRTVMGVRTVIAHSSGEWVENTLEATTDGVAPQALASTITYLRRIGGQMLLGIAGDTDDDGEQGQGDQEGGAAGGDSTSAPSGPRRTDGQNEKKEGEVFFVVSLVDKFTAAPVAGGKTQWRFTIPGVPGNPPSTVFKPLAEKIMKEKGTGMPVRFHLVRNGSWINIENAEVLPAGSLS